MTRGSKILQFRTGLNDPPVACSLSIMQPMNWESQFRCLIQPALPNLRPATLSLPLILHPPICLSLALFPVVSAELRTTCREDRPVKELGRRGGGEGSREAREDQAGRVQKHETMNMYLTAAEDDNNPLWWSAAISGNFYFKLHKACFTLKPCSVMWFL